MNNPEDKVQTNEERKAEWEKTLLAELEAWKTAAVSIGCGSPEELWKIHTSFEFSKKMRFIDEVVLAICADDDISWSECFQCADDGWKTRQEYIKTQMEGAK